MQIQLRGVVIPGYPSRCFDLYIGWGPSSHQPRSGPSLGRREAGTMTPVITCSASAKDGEELVAPTFASWNPIANWLCGLEALRQAV